MEHYMYRVACVSFSRAGSIKFWSDLTPAFDAWSNLVEEKKQITRPFLRRNDHFWQGFCFIISELRVLRERILRPAQQRPLETLPLQCRGGPYGLFIRQAARAAPIPATTTLY